jgi:RsiW-degrading membrane proteinase PrsW (M82 family)
LSTHAALYIRGLGFVAGGALFWLMYFDVKDRLRPEPRRLLVLAFLIGGGSAFVGVALYRLAAWSGLPGDPGTTQLSILLYCLLLVGPIEEGVKFLGARALVFRWKQFDEPIDGLVYAGAVAIGFASVENVVYLPYLHWPEQLARALASPLTHSLFSALWGFGTARAFFESRTRTSRLLWQALPLVLAMVVHGLYDYVLLAHDATFVASAVALVLWIILIVYARRATRPHATPGPGSTVT